MLENEKVVADNNKEMLLITRKREKEREDSVNAIKNAYVKEKEKQKKEEAFKLRMERLQAEDPYLHGKKLQRAEKKNREEIEADPKWKRLAEIS